MAAGPPPAFAQCRACHSVDPGKNGVGPSLANVFGAKAGRVSSYTYSDAMGASGLVWNKATLDRYLASPRTVVPGTKMPIGTSDASKRREIIDYLATL